MDCLSSQPSGARAGIQNHSPHDIALIVVMDPGFAAVRRPGMTAKTFP